MAELRVGKENVNLRNSNSIPSVTMTLPNCIVHLALSSSSIDHSLDLTRIVIILTGAYWLFDFAFVFRLNGLLKKLQDI